MPVLQIAAGKTFTEVEVDELLTSRRAAQPGFVEPSFATIAGVYEGTEKEEMNGLCRSIAHIH
jgi:hypothetical protein